MSDLTEQEVYMRLIDSLKTAAGCATQLAHMRKQRQWLHVRAFLELAVEKITLLAMRKVT